VQLLQPVQVGASEDQPHPAGEDLQDQHGKENVEAARALGIRNIQFFSTEQAISELEALLDQYSVIGE